MSFKNNGNSQSNLQMQLFDAVSNGDVQSVRELMKRPNKGAFINQRDNDGFLSLHRACALGEIEIMKLLLTLINEIQTRQSLEIIEIRGKV